MVNMKVALVAGSGGTGRTTLAANMAHMYAGYGRRALLVDLCFGWGGLNRFASNLPTLSDILECDGKPESIISSTDYGFDLLTCVAPDFVEMEGDDIKKLAWVLDRVCRDYSVIIYDAPSGPHPLSLLASGLSHKVLLFARPDATSFGSAYCLLKALNMEGINSRVSVIFNLVESDDHAVSLKTRFDLVSDRFLGFKVYSSGFVMNRPELFDGEFHIGEINKSSQILLKDIVLPVPAMFQDETSSHSILNTFPGRINHRR